MEYVAAVRVKHPCRANEFLTRPRERIPGSTACGMSAGRPRPSISSTPAGKILSDPSYRSTAISSVNTPACCRCLVGIGHVLGLGSDVAVALSLAKRMREILFGLPALATWQWMTRAKAW
jgi:hypothetical protein